MVARWRRRSGAADADQQAGGRGLLIASGLITGEALVGIALAAPIVMWQDAEILAVSGGPYGAWPGALLLTCIAAWLAIVGARAKRREA